MRSAAAFGPVLGLAGLLVGGCFGEVGEGESLDNPTTGDREILSGSEAPGFCCVKPCDCRSDGGTSSPDGGITTSCSAAPTPKPYSKSTFSCPVSKMAYCPNGQHFDCDDFAYACKRWCDQNGILCWQLYLKWKQADGSWMAHAINVVALTGAKKGYYRFRVVEPRTNQWLGQAWDQPTAKLGMPVTVLQAICKQMGGTSCSTIWASSTAAFDSSKTGEACFLTDAKTCRLFEQMTGLCLQTWKKKK